MTDTDNQQTESSTPIVEGAVAPTTSEEAAAPPAVAEAAVHDLLLDAVTPSTPKGGVTTMMSTPPADVNEDAPKRPQVWNVGAQKFVDAITGE